MELTTRCGETAELSQMCSPAYFFKDTKDVEVKVMLSFGEIIIFRPIVEITDVVAQTYLLVTTGSSESLCGRRRRRCFVGRPLLGKV